jgi:hypothetical protein
VLKIVMDDMQEGEVAAIYQDGEDAVILVATGLPDDQRCEAVNRLLAKLCIKAEPAVRLVTGSAVAGSAVASLLLFTHLLQQVASPSSQLL